MKNNFTFFIYENFNENENSLLFPPELSDDNLEFPLESPSNEVLDELSRFINKNS